MSPAEVVSSRPVASVPAAGEFPSLAIIDTMRSWLRGEPVWTYAKIIEKWGPHFEMYRKKWERREFSPHRTVDMFRLRESWIAEFGFAIPCAELFDELAKAQSIVEVGAGTGYMTRLMRNRGINVIGSDPAMESFAPMFEHAAYDPEQVKAQGKTMVRRHRSATVFCCWPSYRLTWFRQMLKAMQIGQRIIVIREDACGDDTAWAYFERCFGDERFIDIPAFEFMNDIAIVAVKKKQKMEK